MPSGARCSRTEWSIRQSSHWGFSKDSRDRGILGCIGVVLRNFPPLIVMSCSLSAHDLSKRAHEDESSVE